MWCTSLYLSYTILSTTPQFKAELVIFSEQFFSKEYESVLEILSAIVKVITINADNFPNNIRRV